MTEKRSILFMRDFRHRTGGHVTVRDYFLHSLAHPGLEPYVYFTPTSNMLENDLWEAVPADRFVAELRPDDYDLLFIEGMDWLLLPEDLGDKKVVNAILHVRHATQHQRKRYLSRPAYRICNSEEVSEAIAPFANGVRAVIPNAVDYTLFLPDAPKTPGSVLIWGEKNPGLATRLHETLRAEGRDSTLLIESQPRAEFASILSAADVFVALPNATEGFYRPGLEGMACRCAVVCSDAVGNRCYAVDGLTCLQPAYGDFEGHIEAVRRLLDEPELRESVRGRGYERSREFSLAAQRSRYYEFLERYIL